MTSKRISTHEVLIYTTFLDNPECWFTNTEIAVKLESVAGRTVRLHTRKLLEMGLLEQIDLAPAPRFRWSEEGVARNADYMGKMEYARDVLGI